MGLMDKARAFLGKTLKADEDKTVTYTRGASTATLKPWLGQTAFRSDLNGKYTIERSEKDFLFEAVDLKFAGVPFMPQKGDRIAYGGTVYEIMIPSTGEMAWRYSDADNKIVRVHTKAVA